MTLWRKRRPPALIPTPRPNPTRIAALEHDLLGIPPEPGSMAAAVIGIRRAGTCIEHQPVDVGTIADQPGTVMLCTRCGNHLTAGAGDGWRIATTS